MPNEATDQYEATDQCGGEFVKITDPTAEEDPNHNNPNVEPSTPSIKPLNPESGFSYANITSKGTTGSETKEPSTPSIKPLNPESEFSCADITSKGITGSETKKPSTPSTEKDQQPATLLSYTFSAASKVLSALSPY
jgi:hypothetical protein